MRCVKGSAVENLFLCEGIGKAGVVHFDAIALASPELVEPSKFEICAATSWMELGSGLCVHSYIWLHALDVVLLSNVLHWNLVKSQIFGDISVCVCGGLFKPKSHDSIF